LTITSRDISLIPHKAQRGGRLWARRDADVDMLWERAIAVLQEAAAPSHLRRWSVQSASLLSSVSHIGRAGIIGREDPDRWVSPHLSPCLMLAPVCLLDQEVHSTSETKTGSSNNALQCYGGAVRLWVSAQGRPRVESRGLRAAHRRLQHCTLLGWVTEPLAGSNHERSR
jgi:hypothetical protein